MFLFGCFPAVFLRLFDGPATPKNKKERKNFRITKVMVIIMITFTKTITTKQQLGGNALSMKPNGFDERDNNIYDKFNRIRIHTSFFRH